MTLEASRCDTGRRVICDHDSISCCQWMNKDRQEQKRGTMSEAARGKDEMYATIRRSARGLLAAVMGNILSWDGTVALRAQLTPLC